MQKASTTPALGEGTSKAANALVTPHWTAGRQVVQGEVISLKWHSGYRYGDYCGAVLKLADGRAVWFRLPSALSGSATMPRRGAVVRVTLGIEPKPEDRTFAFGDRPTKAEVLAAREEAAMGDGRHTLTPRGDA